MHQVWQSKDLKVTGTEEEVREYERKQEDPMTAMRFPYRINEYGELFGCSGGYKLGEMSYGDERRALVAFANIGGKELKAWRARLISNLNAYTQEVRELAQAFDAACEVARKVNG